MENEHECCKKEDSKKISIRKYVLPGLVALTLLISVLQSFQISSLKDGTTANAVQSAGADMGGWTDDEKMQYEHHGTMPARFQQTRQTSQVGSC